MTISSKTLLRLAGAAAVSTLTSDATEDVILSPALSITVRTTDRRLSSSNEEPSLEATFYKLFAEWKEGTLFCSSLTDICFHPSYQMIMAMGRDALPLVFAELEKELDHWFYALKFIVRKDVAEGAKNLEDARVRWLNWARKKKYLA